MKRGALRAVTVLSLVWASGCVYATKVTGPGGQEAFRIRGGGRPQCLDKASEVCAGEYEVLSSKAEVDGYVNNGTGYAESPYEMVVVCRANHAEGPVSPAKAKAATAAAAEASAGLAAAAIPADPSVCSTAHASVKETAAFWARLYPEAKPLAEPPSQRDFVEVCRGLPERVQRCLDARHREAHDKPCLAVLRRLEPQEKNRIDSLFLE